MDNSLLRNLDEAPKIGILGQSLHDQMQVVGHEAVRTNKEAFLYGGLLNPRERRLNQL